MICNFLAKVLDVLSVIKRSVDAVKARAFSVLMSVFFFQAFPKILSFVLATCVYLHPSLGYSQPETTNSSFQVEKPASKSFQSSFHTSSQNTIPFDPDPSLRNIRSRPKPTRLPQATRTHYRYCHSWRRRHHHTRR